MRRIFAIAAVLAVLLMPVLAHAAPVTFPLVPCGMGATPLQPLGNPPCTPCSLYEGLSRVINLVLFGITAPIAAFMVVLSGGMMLLGGANPANYSTGKKWLTNTLMGVTVILLAWVATNFLINSLGGSLGDSTKWYEFSCPAFLDNVNGDGNPLPPPAASKGSPQQPAAELTAANRAVCTDRAALAGAFKANASVTAVAPSLTTLMNCIEQDPVVKELVDQSKKFTYERDNPVCNLTHGYPVCGECAHSKNSCHYGGRTGTQGAQAVDYNVNSGKPVRYNKETRAITPSTSPAPAGEDPTKFRTVERNDRALFEEIFRSAKKNNCAVALLQYENNSGGPHTHVSTPDCDSDKGGFRGSVIVD